MNNVGLTDTKEAHYATFSWKTSLIYIPSMALDFGLQSCLGQETSGMIKLPMTWGCTSGTANLLLDLCHSQLWNWSAPHWGALEITAHHWWHQPALSQERIHYLFGTDYVALLKSTSRWGNKEKATLFFECSMLNQMGLYIWMK